MRTIVIIHACLAVGATLLPGCAYDDPPTRQRPEYSFQNVDARPSVSGEEYRERDRPDPNAPYATTDAYPNDDGSGVGRR